MALAFNGPTEYGCGFTSEGGAGLTKQGRKLIEWMAWCGIILDLSHAGKQTAYDSLEFIEREKLNVIPMVSHIGCDAVFKHHRNFSDDILSGIAHLHGYVGIYTINFFLSKKHTNDTGYLDAICKHIVHAISVCGDNLVGIGSGCSYTNMTMEEARQYYNRMVSTIESDRHFGEYFPDYPPALILNGETLMSTLMTHISMFLPPLAVKQVFRTSFKDYLLRALPLS